MHKLDDNASINSIDVAKPRLLGVISGIFVTPGIVWQSMGSSGAALMVWILGGVITLAASLSYTELGTRISEQGGELVYLRSSFPKPHNLFSFLFSFMFFFAIRVGSIAAVSQAFAQYLVYSLSTSDECTRYLQINPRNGVNDMNFWTLKFIALGGLLIVTAYHIYSSPLANKINKILAYVKTLTLFTIAVLGIVNLKSPYNNWESFFDGTTLTITSFSTSLISVLYSYNGWNNLNYSLAEFKNPENRLVYSNVISVLIVGCLYILANIAFISVVPSKYAKNPGHEFNEVIAGYFAEYVWNRQFGRVLSFCVAISTFGTLGALCWSGSRVIQTAAEKNYFPIGAEKLRKDDERFNTPKNALITQFIWCTFTIVVVGASITSDPFKILSDYSQYSAWIFYGLTGAALFHLKRKPSDKKNTFKAIIQGIQIVQITKTRTV
ncbi:13369_t:CDS:10 [Acaulospora morrowiae]|uniref:13369_t:CDS:1 n=1 Tax=Acaulospora morrowiae TaxID=94023 RepID=A0A9N9CBJ1_9GLOM|nr:13369_t:CDS:10 [Acaulospora morrowiae]